MTDLLLLISALVASLGTVDVTVREGWVEAPGIPMAGGVAWCHEGKPRIEVSRKAPDQVAILAHELLHAVDCVDNGVMDGSPLPFRCEAWVASCSHRWVDWALDNPVEAARIMG